MTAVEQRKPGAAGNALPEKAIVLRDPDWIKQFAALVGSGVPIAKAARLHYLTPKMVEHWLAKGRLDDACEEYRAFADEVDRAKAYVETRNLTNIQRAADNGDWRAADRMLQIVDRDVYGAPEKGGTGAVSETNIEIKLSFPTGMDHNEEAIDAASTVHEDDEQLVIEA